MFSKPGLKSDLSRIVLYGIGFSSVASVVYLASPYVIIGGWRPFENYVIREMMVAILVAAAAGSAGWHFWRRKKKTGAIEEGIAKEEAGEDGSAVLVEQLTD